MSLSVLAELSKFRNINNFEYEGKMFLTNVKDVAPKAYLHIIFPPADIATQNNKIDPINLPAQIREFYSQYNGMRLFVDDLGIHGFFPESYTFIRNDFKMVYPYDIEDLNQYFKRWNKRNNKDIDLSDIFAFASYGYDRSIVYVRKSDGKIFCCVKEDIKYNRASWNSFDEWLEKEIHRLSNLYDEYGNRLVKGDLALPG